ncbi:Holliday junction branch migration protein RuvA [Flaviflexus massiliensis]|uniref:Holliday junction branch migration protein RuvA n=1 Tax=Flaviflexus massiliensis TaxID=1522309 RepID=UPI0006D5B5D9|nr:Holliday junction branch migration protein RuvA [Flaviflexus massiliensis]
MISLLRGTVVALSASSATIEVGGIGFKVLATATTLSELRVGQEDLLHTSLIVREDSLTLYGFADEDERDTFDILISLTGVGPKIGLAVLSVHTPDILRSIVEREDIPGLVQVPGIGRKGAQRILLELGTKLGPARSQVEVATPASVAGDVVAALVGLGWSEDAAGKAVLAVEEEHGSMPVSNMLRLALQKLGGK